jgi:anti-sigma factor RsiW
MKNRHPAETDLALLAGGECGLFTRLRLNRHVARCGDCRDTVASFSELRSETRLAGEDILPDVDWQRLASEMRANVRLGLAAGECVREVPGSERRWHWKPRLSSGLASKLAFGMAGVVLLVGAGFFLDGLLPHKGPGSAHAAVLESTGSGIAVRTDSGSMTLLNHGDVVADQTVSAQGAIRASYVDGDTGTVTITSVYVE